jgi:hypothetical protein
VATYVYASSQGQRTHSALTKSTKIQQAPDEVIILTGSRLDLTGASAIFQGEISNYLQTGVTGKININFLILLREQ